VKKKKFSYWWGVTLMRITPHGAAPIVMVEETLLLNFLILLPWRSSIRAVNLPSAPVLGER
jgi:hypothetical protein